MPEKNTKVISILLLIGIAVLFIGNLNLNNRIANLENAINHAQFNQAQEMQNIRWEITHNLNTINEQITQGLRQSFDETIHIRGYNSLTVSADVEISFRLKEYALEDTVSVIARGANGHIVESKESFYEAGRFTATMTLPIQDHYSLSFTSSGLSIRSGALMKFSIADVLCDRFKYSLAFGQFSGTNPLERVATFTPFLSNDTQGNEALQINSISLMVESNGIEIGNWDLLPYLRSEGNIQVVDIIDKDREDFQLPIWADSGQNDIEHIIPDEFTFTRLVIYDNLGIRYEQLDQMHIFGSPNRFGGGGGAVAVAPFSLSVNRVIAYGEHAWHFIHIVK